MTGSSTRRWRKSSYSNNDSACVELASTLDAMRDSKNPAGPVMQVAALHTFVSQVKAGRFTR
jgi:cytochrome b